MRTDIKIGIKQPTPYREALSRSISWLAAFLFAISGIATASAATVHVDVGGMADGFFLSGRGHNSARGYGDVDLVQATSLTPLRPAVMG